MIMNIITTTKNARGIPGKFWERSEDVFLVLSMIFGQWQDRFCQVLEFFIEFFEIGLSNTWNLVVF